MKFFIGKKIHNIDGSVWVIINIIEQQVKLRNKETGKEKWVRKNQIAKKAMSYRME